MKCLLNMTPATSSFIPAMQYAANAVTCLYSVHLVHVLVFSAVAYAILKAHTATTCLLL